MPTVFTFKKIAYVTMFAAAFGYESSIAYRSLNNMLQEFSAISDLEKIKFDVGCPVFDALYGIAVERISNPDENQWSSIGNGICKGFSGFTIAMIAGACAVHYVFRYGMFQRNIAMNRTFLIASFVPVCRTAAAKNLSPCASSIQIAKSFF